MKSIISVESIIHKVNKRSVFIKIKIKIKRSTKQLKATKTKKLQSCHQ